MEALKDFKDNQFDLAIVDPPYYRTKGKFDFAWLSFNDYLESVEIWAVELKRVLKDDGCFFWWGNHRKIAYTQICLLYTSPSPRDRS